MYITINSNQMNGKLFKHGGLFGKGKLQTKDNIDTRLQVFMSDSSITFLKVLLVFRLQGTRLIRFFYIFAKFLIFKKLLDFL